MEENNLEQHEERQKYYVDVHGKQLHLQQGIAAYDLEIIATKEEARRIDEQFRVMDERDESSINLMLRFNQSHNQQIIEDNNHQYNEDVRTLFALLFECGTEKTRQHILSMNVI